jgi:hypothetical protein
VPLVVVDPLVLAKAFLAPADPGRCRKLTVVLAYGRWRYSLDQLALEEQALREIALKTGGPSPTSGSAAAEKRLSELRAKLPESTPDRYAFAASTPLYYELQDVLHNAAKELPSWRSQSQAGDYAVLATGLLTAQQAPIDKVKKTPECLARLGRGAYLVHTALLTEAPFLISNDALITGRSTKTYHCPNLGAMRTQALSLGTFIDQELEGGDFRLHDVDGRLLDDALGLLYPP